MLNDRPGSSSGHQGKIPAGSPAATFQRAGVSLNIGVSMGKDFRAPSDHSPRCIEVVTSPCAASVRGPGTASRTPTRSPHCLSCLLQPTIVERGSDERGRGHMSSPVPGEKISPPWSEVRMIRPCLCPICILLLLEVSPGGQALSTGFTHALFMRPSWTPAISSFVGRGIGRSRRVSGAQKERNVDAA